jgi:hypothetical protein
LAVYRARDHEALPDAVGLRAVEVSEPRGQVHLAAGLSFLFSAIGEASVWVRAG